MCSVETIAHLIRRRVPALVAASLWACVSAAPRPVTGQEVEILVGGGEAAGRGAGIRMTAVLDRAGRTDYRPVEPLTGREVVAIQRALVAAGSDPGPIDGRLGPRVAAALSAFQARMGLPACGCIDGSTLEALGLRIRVVHAVVGVPRSTAEVEILAPSRPAPPAEPDPTASPPDTAVERLPAIDPAGAPWWVPVPVSGASGSASAAGPAPRGGRPIGTSRPGRVIRVPPSPSPR